MAIKRVQYMVRIISINDIEAVGNRFIFEDSKCDLVQYESERVPVSENRLFRMFCHSDMEAYQVALRDEKGNHVRDDEGMKMYEDKYVKSAREFTIIDMSKDTKENDYKIRQILAKGFYVRTEDGEVTRFNRCIRTSSQVRVHKAFFTSLDVEEVRRAISYGADFGEEVIIAQMESRYGLGASSTLEIKHEDFSFDIMPDFAIERKHDVKIWNHETKKLEILKDHENEYEPLDGQGTMLPSAAVRISHSLGIISRKDRQFALNFITNPKWNEDVSSLIVFLKTHDKQTYFRFMRIWNRIPSAFQIRYAFTKGLLLVHPHNLEKYDCNQKTYRDRGKCMSFWKDKGEVDEQGRHYYDFDRDIMFTDSMWKANFDPEYLTGKHDVYAIEREEIQLPNGKTKLRPVLLRGKPNMEIVLWQKNRPNETVFTGEQIWQVLDEKKADPKDYADEEINRLKDTIFTNTVDALSFLGMYDTSSETDENGNTEYENRIIDSAGKIQKAIMLLNENPEMIEERWVQEVIRDTREKYIKDMSTGRIPVRGANPYIATSIECQFGRESKLQAGEYYYNNEITRVAGFRFPLIHKSEAVVLNMVELNEYEGLYKDILIMNPYDDTLPRMGGADTDGDKIAIVRDEQIIDAVFTGLPMLYDEGFKGQAKPNTASHIWAYDCTTILASIMTIGEITNMATTWKDVAQNPKKIKEMFPKSRKDVALELIDNNVCILRFTQGWSIDYAKTAFFAEPPKYALTQKSPHFKPWSKNAALFGFKGAEVYQSVSQLGELYDGVRKYLKEAFKEEIKESTRDFTFEFTDNCSHEEILKVKPIIAELENNYRKELYDLKNMNLDEETERDYIVSIMDKYRMAVLSIPADIRAIAGAAYVHSYYESKSKSNKISFPWVTCFEGLLLNVSETSTNRLKLRKARYDGHIDDIPEALTFYRGASKGEDYEVTASVPNGTFQVHKKGATLFIVVKSKSLAKKVMKETEMPKNRHLAFQINSFQYHNVNAVDIVELLKENDGIIKIQKTKDTNQKVNSIHAGVWIGDCRVGNVNRHNKHQFISYLNGTSVELQVVDYEKMNGTYVNKKKEEKIHKFFNIEAIVMNMIEADMIREKEEQEVIDHYSEYDEYGYEYDMPSQEEIISPEIELDDIELDEENDTYYAFDYQIMNRLKSKADYWNVDVDASDFDIIGVSIEQWTTNTTYKVDLIRVDGKKATFFVDKSKELKQFVIVEGSKNEKLNALALKVVHYELYKEFLENKKQA